ncbi:MAG: ABC transporter substrate-binding protein, partial [Nitrospirota bacterium]|nr:ABC transporter substrate-binding protein [Nitrospirota bacterium]
SAPTNFDPRFATDATSSRINRLLYERLIDFDETFHPIPSLAEWEMISTTHYRFHLKPNQSRFHDGTRLTAKDVKATYDFILEAQNASPHRRPLSLIKEVLIPGRFIIDFLLSRPDPLFPGYLAISILPAHLIATDHPFHSDPIGSGPFAFVSRHDDTRITLKRLADNQAFEFITVPDPTVRALKLLANEIDLAQNDFPPELVSYLEKDEEIRIERHPGSNFSYLGFNFADPLTQQITIRQAIAHAIDRDALIQFVLGEAAHPAESLLVPNHWAGAQHLTPYNHDPDKARALIRQAGYTLEHPAPLTYKTSSDPFRVRLATIIQYQLGQVGIDVDVRSYDWGTFYGDIKAGQFQMYSLAWVGIKTPDIFHNVFHSQSVPPEGANRGRFHSPIADRLIERAEQAQDLSEKRSQYQGLQRHLHETLPFVPLWYEDHVLIARRDIQGFVMTQDGNYDGLKFVHRQTSTGSEN